MEFENASATPFRLDVAREVRLLDGDALAKLFGASAAATIARPGVKSIGYQTVNQIINCGQSMTQAKGLPSIWILGMMNSGPETVVVVPYRPGEESALGPVVKSDYFGAVPPERLKIVPQAILFRADNNWRSKIGVSQRRPQHPRLDRLSQPRAHAGPLQHAGRPDQAAVHEQHVGRSARRSVHRRRGQQLQRRPARAGKNGLGAFYEIESLSPAEELQPGESLEHRHATIHVQAGLPTLVTLAKNVLGVDLDDVRREMLAK